MDSQELYEGMGHIDEEILERSEKNKVSKPRKRPGPNRMGLIAAALALVICGSALLRSGILLSNRETYLTQEDQTPSQNTDSTEEGTQGQTPSLQNPLVLTVRALEEAVYPQMVEYPQEEDYYDLKTGEMDLEGLNQAFGEWRESVQAQRQEEGYAKGLEPFFTATMREFLSGPEGENRLYSPLNVYLALGMLAEISGGESREQILDLLGAESIEALRDQAKAVWNAQYRDDGATASILASSLWLDEALSFSEEPLKTLADTYYASSYLGQLGSEESNQALRQWLNDQTGGLLEDQIQEISLDPETILALATTLYYKAGWDVEFHEHNTCQETFYGTQGELSCQFMHGSFQETYYWGDTFTAVGQKMANDGGTMWLILPDEGVSIQEMLEQEETMRFLLSNGQWDRRKDMKVHLSMPRLDVSGNADLGQGLRNLGVTEVFAQQRADFSPLGLPAGEAWLSQVSHGVRVKADEEGVEAAAYTLMLMENAEPPSEEEVSFTLNRPFVFAITSEDGLPLFTGTVYDPA